MKVSPALHGRDHRPGGADPIPGLITLEPGVWYPLTLINGAAVAGSPFAAPVYRVGVLDTRPGWNVEFDGSVGGLEVGTAFAQLPVSSPQVRPNSVVPRVWSAGIAGDQAVTVWIYPDGFIVPIAVFP